MRLLCVPSQTRHQSSKQCSARCEGFEPTPKLLRFLTRLTSMERFHTQARHSKALDVLSILYEGVRPHFLLILPVSAAPCSGVSRIRLFQWRDVVTWTFLNGVADGRSVRNALLYPLHLRLAVADTIIFARCFRCGWFEKGYRASLSILNSDRLQFSGTGAKNSQ